MATTTQNNILNLIVHIFPLVIFLLLLFAFYNIRRTGIIFNSYSIGIFILFVLMIIAAGIYYNKTFVPALSNFTIFSVGIILLYVLANVVYNTILYYASISKSASYFILITLAIAIGFSLLLILLTYLFSNEAIQEFLKLLLSIPNIIVDFAEEFSRQLPNSPPAFIILFILEVILILIIALVPFLVSQNPPLYSSPNINGIFLLQKDPLNLTTKNEAVLANSHDLSIVDDSNVKKNPYQKNFTISLWVYMNPSESAQNPNEMTLFYYGHKEHGTNGKKWQVANPKPKITYIYDPVQRRDMYYLYLQETDPTTPTYKFHIPNQKWNHFIFIFQEDHVEFYINGHLEKSFPYSMGITKTYTNNDQIVVGDADNISYGSIANVIYYDYPMTQNQVIDTWNKQRYWVDGTVYLPYSKVN